MAEVLTQPALCADDLYLAFGECVLRVRSNSTRLRTGLADYFAHIVCTDVTPDVDIIAIDRDAPELDINFIDWQPAAGTIHSRISYADLPGGRLVRNTDSGMMFLQSAHRRIVAGPCVKYQHQVINFINTQFMNWLQNRGWLNCAATGVVYHGRSLAIAGSSESCKSRLMLHLLDNHEVCYLGHDHLFMHTGSGQVDVRGTPTLPRITAESMLAHQQLYSLIPPHPGDFLLQLSAGELWQREAHYDVPVDRIYGSGRMKSQAPLAAILILDWQHNSTGELQLERVKPALNSFLLDVLMSSPGPFYQYPDGSFQQPNETPDESAYLDALNNVAVYVARGRADFSAITDRCLQELLA
ncbi:MAG: HprK-related kinase B [Gammaproteobacteria bacterium]